MAPIAPGRSGATTMWGTTRLVRPPSGSATSPPAARRSSLTMARVRISPASWSSSRPPSSWATPARASGRSSPASAGAGELMATTTTRAAPSSSAGFTGGFSRVPPARQPPAAPAGWATPAGDERERGLHRRVQRGAAVEVPAGGRGRLLDPDGREQRRDGGRGQHVVDLEPGGDVVDAAPLVVPAGGGAAGAEDHAAVRPS